nr:MAG TPA: hypothetical protein [Caudoviricetes sp.]
MYMKINKSASFIVQIIPAISDPLIYPLQLL